MFRFFCGDGKLSFLTKLCSKGFKCLFGASCVKEDIDWFCVFDSTSENKKKNLIAVKKMIAHRLEWGPLRDSQMR